MAKPDRVGAVDDVIAEQVRRARNRHGWSVRQLAEKCAELGGASLTQASLNNIERGLTGTAGSRGGRAVTVQELLILARVLGLPPLLFVFPVGHRETAAVLPGEEPDAWAAAKWFTGEARYPSELVAGGDHDGRTGLHDWYDDPEIGWETGAAPVQLLRQHDRQVEQWYEATDLARLLATTTKSFEDMVTKLRARAEERIRQTRAEMRRAGLALPTLPEDLAELDSPRRHDRGRR
jgi:transcriptional regulator with XRE-family HTH domain